MSRRGFSVVECLLVMLLFSILLASTSQVLQLYGSGFHRMRSQGQQAGEGFLVLKNLTREVEQCRQLVTPSGAGVQTELVFVTLDPAFEALPEPAPSPPPLTFVAEPPGALATVRYWLSSRQLLREVTLAARTSSILAGEPFDSFTAESLSDGTLELKLTITAEGRVVTCKSRIFRP